MPNELLSAAEDFASRMTAVLDTVEQNCVVMLQAIEQRQATREHMVHATQTEVFKAKRNYYHAVADMVREFGHRVVIEHRREAARTNGTSPKTLREFECLVRAIAAGMSVSEHLEYDSPQSWFARKAANETENL